MAVNLAIIGNNGHSAIRGTGRGSSDRCLCCYYYRFFSLRKNTFRFTDLICQSSATWSGGSARGLRVAMSLYTLPSPYASCLGIITRLRGITRLVNGGLGLLLSPGSVIPGGACGVIENATGKGLSVAVIKVSCSGRPFCVTVIRMPARSKLRTLMPLSVPFSAIQ